MTGAETVLGRIAGNVARRLEERKGRLPVGELRALAERSRRPHDFRAAVARADRYNVIAEVKFASPSQGRIASDQAGGPVEVARGYLASGAAALSVLTEQDHFNGRPEYLQRIRASFPEARLLMKDFVIDEYQLLEARAHGADAALLIVALLGRDRAAELLAEARRLGLTALVEVHDEEELGIAEEIGAELIGVNNRNLKTLEVSLETSFRLAKAARRGCTLVAESGLERGSELPGLRKAGFSAFLIGTSFMRTGDPGRALSELLSSAGEAR